MAAGKDIKAGRAWVSIDGDKNPLVKALRSAGKSLEDFGKQAAQIGAGIAAIGASIGAGILSSAAAFASAGDELHKMALRTGASSEALSALAFAASLSGSSIEGVEKGITKMQRAVSEATQGLKTAQDAFATLGLNADEMLGMAPEEQFKLIADRLTEIEDPALKAGAAIEIFGKSGTALLPLMEGGAAGINAMMQEAEALGLVMSTETVASAAALNDAMDKVKRTMMSVVHAIGEAVAPVLTEMGERAAKVIAVVSKFIRENKALVVMVGSAAASIFAFGSAISGAGLAIAGLGVVLQYAGTALAVILPFFTAIASPAGVAAAAVAGLGIAIMTMSKSGRQAIAWLVDYFHDLKEIAGTTLGGIQDAFSAGDLGLAITVMMAGGEVALREGIAPFYEAWSELRLYLSSVLADATASLRSIWVDFATWWWQNFPNLTSGIAKIWAQLWGGVANTYNKAVGAMTNVWADTLEFFGVIDNADEVKAENRKIVREEENRLADEMAKAIAEAERKSAMSPEELAADAAERKAGILADADASITAATQAHMNRMQAAEAALSSARDALAASVGEASAAAQRARERAPGIPARIIEDPVMAQKRGLEARGTYSGAALGQQFGTNSNKMDRIRDAIEEASGKERALLREMLQELRRNRGPVLT